MRYYWHKIAQNEPLPMGFQHILLHLKDGCEKNAKVYAIGTRQDSNKGLEVYKLDDKLESWNKVEYSFENEAEVRHKPAVCDQNARVLSGVRDTIYVIMDQSGLSSNVMLRLDTIEQKWSMQNISGASVDVTTILAAATVGEKIIMFGSDKVGINVYAFDTTESRLKLLESLGPPPPASRFSVVPLVENRILVHGAGFDKDIWLLEVGTDVVTWSKCKHYDNKVPVVICGPSGVGKGTLIGKLMKEFPNKFGFSVSHTTRLPREQETNGVHYHFTSRDAMQLDVENGKFLEHANVHGNLYGTSIAAVEAVADAGKRCLLDIDVQGAKSVRKSSMQALYIFITPPSFEELERRLRGRGTETEEQVHKRLQTAKRELELGKDPSLFDYVLINDDLETTYKQLKTILGLSGDIDAEVPDSCNMLAVANCGSSDVYLLDKSAKVNQWLRLEAREKPRPLDYTNTSHLNDLEIIMTTNEGDTITIRVSE